MSVLVWSVESAILGLWALALTYYTSPFHAFIAYSHASIAGFTLAAQLFSVVRDLPIQHAISEAYVCAVCALFLTYLMPLLDPETYSNRRYFALPALGDGLLPTDACVAIGWFTAVWLSAIGMALSVPGKKHALMFHHYGYHMVIVLPSFLIFWLYNYNGQKAEPISQTIAFLYRGARITHSLYTLALIGIWGVFVLLQATGEGLQIEAEWPSFDRMSHNGGLRYTLSVGIKLLGRAACVLIPLSAAFSANTNGQIITTWILVGIGAANAFNWLEWVDRLIAMKRKQQAPPDIEPATAPPDPAAFALPWRDKRA